MNRLLLSAVLVAAALPASAATKNIFSAEFYKLTNTDFIVTIAFLIFMGVLWYFKVPGMIAGLLDKRAVQIRSDLDEARALRDEAQSLLASYERKQREVAEQSARIVAQAREEAQLAADEAKRDLEKSVARRLQAAEEKIASAEASAIRGVRDQAVQVAIAAAGDVLAKQMTKESAAGLIDDAIKTVEARLH
ncbi:F0F1 ATP synthase subunit B [Palleronia sp. KMU-117]|uniref:F0F1 ATP synthase subunit B n=1 Tax=Palleronia sp. KMU-117 TaxID=3434108 RepID=UPI003D72A8CA